MPPSLLARRTAFHPVLLTTVDPALARVAARALLALLPDLLPADVLALAVARRVAGPIIGGVLGRRPPLAVLDATRSTHAGKTT